MSQPIGSIVVWPESGKVVGELARGVKAFLVTEAFASARLAASPAHAFVVHFEPGATWPDFKVARAVSHPVDVSISCLSGSATLTRNLSTKLAPGSPGVTIGGGGGYRVAAPVDGGAELLFVFQPGIRVHLRD